MLIPRKINLEIKKWLPKKEIIILNGARQVGKTSILKLIEKDLLKTKINKKNIFYLNLEELRILSELNKDPENIRKYILDEKETNFFLIDEIQYLDNPSNFLKHIYDKYAPKIKLIITGSSSLELKAHFQDSLVGRKISFQINPLDFEEFLNFRKFSHLDYLAKKELPAEIQNAFLEKLNEYLLFGGMPAVALEGNFEIKKKMLNEYVNTYINKDIRAIGKIENISKFNDLVKLLASQIGNLLNISEVSNTLDLDRRKVLNYLDLLKLTFVLNKIKPFKKNIRSQISKMPKIYFFDLGVRNAILDNFLDLFSRQDAGALFENFIFCEFKNIFSKIYFFRTKSGAEIDFVIEKEGKINLFEVKYKKLKKKIDERQLKNFVKKQGNIIAEASVINLSLNLKNDKIQYLDYRVDTQ